MILFEGFYIIDMDGEIGVYYTRWDLSRGMLDSQRDAVGRLFYSGSISVISPQKNPASRVMGPGEEGL